METARPPRYRRARELAGLSIGQAASRLGWTSGSWVRHPLVTFCDTMDEALAGATMNL